MRQRREGGWVGGRRPPPLEGEQVGHGAPAPSCPPTPLHRLASRGGAGPHPPEAEGMIPPPPRGTAAREREAGEGPAPTPQPPAPARSTKNIRTRANTPGRHTDRARRGQTSRNRSSMGATPSMARATPRTPALMPPPPTHPPALERPRRADPPSGERTAPSQVGRKMNRAAPPPSKPNGARDRGRTRGGARTAQKGPISTQHRDHARCARHTNQGRGGGADAAGARAHTHTQRTRGEYQKGNRTELAERTDRRVKDTRTRRPARHSAGHAGWEGGNGQDTTPGTDPSLPNRPRAPRTHDQGTAPAKAVVAHCATPQPQTLAASAPAHRGPTGNKPVARARQRRHPGRPRIRGATGWVSARSHGCKLMH